jgi:hypothetical protein
VASKQDELRSHDEAYREFCALVDGVNETHYMGHFHTHAAMIKEWLLRRAA